MPLKTLSYLLVNKLSLHVYRYKINKWKALVNTYKKYTDEANRSGSGRKNTPAYYEELSEIYGYRPNVKPFVTVEF